MTIGNSSFRLKTDLTKQRINSGYGSLLLLGYIGSRNPFGRFTVDQTIEETVNKDMQTSGGTKGLFQPQTWICHQVLFDV